ncbi:MAG: hypothetical protein NVSMB17_09580 [Candidatus Dormibacteria bacterium]
MTPASDPVPSLETTLNDGTRLTFRPIRPDDKGSLQRGIEQMSPESRYRRFFAPLDHLSEAQLTYFTEVDQVDHVAWLGILAGDPDEKAIAVARFIRIPGQPAAAEAAVTVIDEFQGRGVGRAMLVVITREAIARGITCFSMFVLGEIRAMLGLLHDAGAISDGVHECVFQMHVDLPDRVEDLNESAAPRILRVAAEGNLRGEVAPGQIWTRFVVGEQ